VTTSSRLLDPTSCCPEPEGKSSKYEPTQTMTMMQGGIGTQREGTARMATPFVARRRVRVRGKAG
jgi:hypothetical protein